MSLHLSNNNDKENEEKIDPENLIKDGIDIIYQSFNTNMENYIEQIKELKKLINDLNKKLELMKEEIEMLQRENEYYKTQNKKLKKEVENMNKVVNNIKGKLINFDLNINPKQIFQNISQENLSHKSHHKYNKNERKNQYNIRNNLEQDNNTINNLNNNSNFYRDHINNEISRNSQTIRYEIKNSNFNELINESEINSINYDDILSEINPGNNIINYFNNSNKRQLHTLYSDLNIRNKNKVHNKNYNEENSKNNNYQNMKRKSIDYSYMNKKNINFNSYKNINTYRRKNKIKNNSLNNIIKKEKINNDIKYLIKKNNWKNRPKEKDYIKLNLNPLLDGSDNFDFNNQICKTFQNNKNININNNCIKELKMKEIAFFIEKCKTYLDNEEFEIIFDIYQKYKEEIIKDKNIIKQLKFYLKSNEQLLNLFNNIIL